MSKYRELYNQKLVSPEEAVKHVKDNDFIITPVGIGETPALFRALAAYAPNVRGVSVNQILPLSKHEYLKPELFEHVRHNAWFLGGATRAGHNEGWVDLSANYFYEAPRLMRENNGVDVVMCRVSPMDEHGFFSMGGGVDYTWENIPHARVVLLEVNENYPRTHGKSSIHISEVTALIENNDPLPQLAIPPITETDEKIGGYVAELIPDGATVQIGFGGVPNAVCKFLMEKKDLGVHTEMITDGMVDLVESGVVNCRKKNLHRGKIIGTFAAGTQRLYDFLNDNPMIEMHPVSYTNDPYVIGQNDNMHAVNASVEVDLFGQCCSESIGTYRWSGTGGQADFIRGATRSKGGKGIITIASTAKNGTISKIVPTLQPGAVVTTTKNDVDYVVTEFGVAHLRGRTARERALALINIAHPNFREELKEAARKMFLI